jgi:hypothetical protein
MSAMHRAIMRCSLPLRVPPDLAIARVAQEEVMTVWTLARAAPTPTVTLPSRAPEECRCEDQPVT